MAAAAILGEWFGFQLVDFNNIILFDWLAAGPGAGAGSFENYVTFMISGIIAGGGFALIRVTWEWASRTPNGADAP